MLKKTEDLAVPASKGLNTIYNILGLEPGQTPNCMDVNINYDGSIEERLGTNTQNAVIIAASAAAGFSTNSTGTLTTNLSSYWKLDEISGNRADIVGAVTLLDSGNTMSTSGIKNLAALFSAATGQCLYQANPSTLTANPSFSISSWIYLNSTSKTLQQTIVSKRDLLQGNKITTLLHMDGSNASTTFTDSETTPKVWTASGNAIISTAQSQFGGASGSFDGIGSYIQTPHHADFSYGSSSFTIEGFVRPSGLSLIQTLYDQSVNTIGDNFLLQITAANVIRFFSQNVGVSNVDITGATALSQNTWYHFAIVRNGTNFTLYLNGNNDASANFTGSLNYNAAAVTAMGAGFNTTLGIFTNFLNGNLDEVKIQNGVAAYGGNFPIPSQAFPNPSGPKEFEYWLYVDTNNQITFDVSSSGTVANGSVTASSFGALTTATWYNTVAWLDGSNNILGLSVNLATNSASYTNGIISSSAPFVLGAVSNGAASFIDGRIDETGYWNKVLVRGERQDLYNSGAGDTYVRAFDTQTWASFDFGASSLRWLTVAAGTGLYASSNLGATFVNIATDRTATYQYLDRSKNVLVATSDAYDVPLAWSGSAGTFATTLNSNATACKFNINYQGFLILLNSSARKRGFFYQDENTQLTGTWVNNFDIPSSADDEITAAFVLRRYLYVSTRYKLYRVSYVGGNPDWSFQELKSWGFIPRTVKKVILTNQTPGIGLYYSIGEIAIGLTWDRKLRVFDGSNDQIISNPVEKDNGQCDFAIEKIGYEGSGPVISFAETDPNQNVYHLCVAIGKDSSATTHFLNYDGRGFSFYPWSNMPYNTMCMAESSNQRYLMAFDRSGKCHMMNSGTLDANTTAITGFYDTPLVFNKTPAQSTKAHKLDMFFSNTTAGGLQYYDRIDASTIWRLRDSFLISGSDQKIIYYKTIDIPETFNTYQGRLITNSSTNSASLQPWRLMRYDLFNVGLGIGKND